MGNTAAAAALVKAGSPTVTMSRIALQTHAMLAALDCHIWIEHIPSKDNPADVLSRDGLLDPSVRQCVDSGEWLLREPVVPHPFSSLSYDELWVWGRKVQ